MVWQEDVYVIAMVTNLSEGGTVCFFLESKSLSLFPYFSFNNCETASFNMPNMITYLLIIQYFLIKNIFFSFDLNLTFIFDIR